MIDQALSFVTKQLHQFLKQELDVDHSLVELSNIPAPHTLAKLIVTVVQIEQEASFKNQPTMGYGNNALIKDVPPLYVNLHFLISVSSSAPYLEGLKYLSLAMRFFQQQPIINREMQQLPKGINKLVFELMNLDAETQKNLWQSLGTSYQPSVVYKLRMLEVG